MAKTQLRTTLSLHESVREEILNRIESGVYQPEEPIPSAAMLSEEFGVSPITVKRALRDLHSGGALVSVAGKGTYVKKQRRVWRELDVWMSSMDDAAIQLISITREKISDSTLRAFNPPEDVMLCVRKIIFADDEPFLYDATFLSSEVDGEIIDEFGQSYVTDALDRHDIHVITTDLIIEAAPAAGMVEEIFGIPTGYPMLRRLYKIQTSDPNITIFGIVQAPFDMLSCSISLPGNSKNTIVEPAK
ncbi:GntR family transcriptional regulator [Mesorhizobium sp. LNHC209A00]|uniref:GntR family transcriptional regulator n=1 Tax=Mesorhizobium TaxID=68287 RepID=UPI0018DCC3FB|nr:GntR family transcriptional regulator [Mesorhizobium sp. LNHC209A00]